ncbi:hypothetical protein ACP70R_024226 [Stipagrostis hirtigluma subsp. patula]
MEIESTDPSTIDLAAMESTKNDARETSTPSPSPPPSDDHAAGGGDDLISALPDDVLLRVLGLVADAAEVVRTAALSRRWRGLWKRAPVLSFAPWPELESAGDAERYAAFVGDVLGRRAQSDDDLELLHISFTLDRLRGEEQLVPLSVGAAEGWIRCGVQHAELFFFRLRLPQKANQDLDINYDDDDDDHDHDHQDEEEQDEVEEEEQEKEDKEVVEEQEAEEEEEEEEEEDDDENNDDDEVEDEEKPMIALDELPSSAKLQTMCLALNSVRVRLPSDVVFASLANVRLEFIDLEAGSGRLLTRLLSSACCPSLQRLHMLYINFKHAETKDLVLDAGALHELSLENMNEMTALELRTPNLLDLKVNECEELKVLTVVSAPMLEDLVCLRNCWHLDIRGDLSSVRRLRVNLTSHGLSDYDINDTEISIIRRCSSARSIRGA